MVQEKKLLVISDKSHDEAMALFWKPGDWKVTFASGLNEALAIVDDLDPELVIADIQVSDLSDDVLRLVRETPETAFVPILAEGHSDFILECFRAGAYDVLIYPVRRITLKSLFARFDQYSSLLRENRLYRDQLEHANRELQDSLRILELDQKAGKQVQQSMLPPSPVRAGDYEIAFHIVPSLFLSGDFVGYHVVFDRYLLFYLADVSGHGASSAFITILLNFLLNKIVRRHVQSKDFEALSRAPEGFLEHINRQLIQLNVDKHATMFAGSLDMKKNILRYSIGAHLPPPVFLSGGDARFVQGKGRPIGIFPDIEWAVEEIALPDKFILTLTSDGVLDFVEGDTLQDKMGGLLGAITDSDGTLESICTNLNVHNVVEVPDDVTVLTVTRGY